MDDVNVILSFIMHKENAMSTQDYKFAHIRVMAKQGIDPDPYGGLTVAFITDEETNSIHYAVSRVHENDRYVRATGRTISMGHLDKFLTGEDTSRGGVITLQQILGDLEHPIKPASISKLNINDLGWYALVTTLKGIIVVDERFNKGTEYLWW